MTDSLLRQGTDLMLYGMGTVFLFLTLLVILTTMMSFFIRRFFPEYKVLGVPEQRENSTQDAPVSKKTIAIIKAALEQHRKGC